MFKSPLNRKFFRCRQQIFQFPIQRAIDYVRSDPNRQRTQSKHDPSRQHPSGSANKLEKIVPLARRGSSVFSCGVHFGQIPRDRPYDLRLRFWAGSIDRTGDRPPGVLFGAGHRFFMLCAAALVFLQDFQRGGDCVVAATGVLGGIVRRDCVRLHPAVGQNESDVADSHFVDGHRVLPQRIVLLQILLGRRQAIKKNAAIFQMLHRQAKNHSPNC